MIGVILDRRSKSSIVRSISAAFAMASKCKIPLVEPWSAKIARIAFSKDLLDRMSLGLIFFCNKLS